MNRAALNAAGARLAIDEPIRSHLDMATLPRRFRAVGMYPPGESCREGAAAFTVRTDLRVCDALESVEGLLRQAGALVDMLGTCGADPTVAGAAEAIAHLLAEARGLHSLVAPVLCRLAVPDSAEPEGAALARLIPANPCAGMMLSADEAAGLIALRGLLDSMAAARAGGDGAHVATVGEAA
jgi:hypothetical protein